MEKVRITLRRVAILGMVGTMCLFHAHLFAKTRCLTTRIGITTVPLQEVECYCPCDMYRKDPRRNMCIRCGHYHEEETLEVDPSKA